MIDPLSAAMSAFHVRSAAAMPLAAVAGTLTSFGPCVAPRYLAVAALVDDRRPWAAIAAFIGGLVLAFAAIGTAVGAVAALLAQSTIVYAMLATALIIAGLATLYRDPRACCEPDSTDAPTPTPASGAFVLGATSVLVVSPCCTPAMTTLGAAGALGGDPLGSVMLLGCFALGHALPMLLLGGTTSIAQRALRSTSAGHASRAISGALTIALGAYYAVLA